MKILFGLCLLLLCPILLRAKATSTNVGFFTGNDLVTQCRHDLTVDTGKTYLTPCTAYILGVDAGASQASRAHPKDGIWMCIPMGTPKDRIIGAVLKYAEKHPEEATLAAWKIVINSLLIEFPCPNKG